MALKFSFATFTYQQTFKIIKNLDCGTLQSAIGSRRSLEEGKREKEKRET
jgi:hypothetical protein